VAFTLVVVSPLGGAAMPSLVLSDSSAALERCTYLNQAALGLIPIPAVAAMHAFIERTAQHGNLDLSDQQEAEMLEGVRSAGAELLGTTPDAVAVVGGASEGLGQIASLLEAGRGTVLLVSTDFPSVFLRMARFISPNSADGGSSNFAAIVAFALMTTGSDVSAGRPDAGAWTLASMASGFAFFAASWGPSRTAAVDRFSALTAMLDLGFVVAALVLDGAGSTGRLAPAR